MDDYIDFLSKLVVAIFGTMMLVVLVAATVYGVCLFVAHLRKGAP